MQRGGNDGPECFFRSRREQNPWAEYHSAKCSNLLVDCIRMSLFQYITQNIHRFFLRQFRRSCVPTNPHGLPWIHSVDCDPDIRSGFPRAQWYLPRFVLWLWSSLGSRTLRFPHSLWHLLLLRVRRLCHFLSLAQCYNTIEHWRV